jgi:NitT/TauT family transport system permease protein/taurine transport system permease protein/sulfonate transport system permease protein
VIATREPRAEHALAVSLASLAALAILWQLAGAGAEDVPTPIEAALKAASMLADGTLARALLVSWRTVLEGFVLAAAVGVPLGIAAGYSEGFGSWILPVVNLLRPIAPFAWIPVAILWFGVGGGAGIMITAYAAFFPIVTNTLGGTARVRSQLTLAARTLGASTATIFLRVVLPGALPLIMVGLRLGMGLAWAAVIAAELATGRSTTAPPGIGYLMYLNFAVEADVNAIVAMMAAIGLSALAADLLLRLAGRRLIHWPAEQ